MATMQEEMAKVNYAECNDWEKNFYDDQKDGTYTPSPKQMGIINKMPKLTNGSAPSQPDTSFNHGSNVSEPTRTSNVDDMIDQLGVIVSKLESKEWYQRCPADSQQKHATTIFLSARK
jgi:hypothetical protein